MPAVTEVEEHKLFIPKRSRRASTKTNHCDKAKKGNKKVLGEWSAEFEALRDNLKTAADRTDENDQSIGDLKQELADLKVIAAKKGKAVERREKMNGQLRSELEQQEHYNQYWAND